MVSYRCGYGNCTIFPIFSHCVATNRLLFCRKNNSRRRVTNDIFWLTLIRFLIGTWWRLTYKERLWELGYVLLYYIWYLYEEFFKLFIVALVVFRVSIVHVIRGQSYTVHAYYTGVLTILTFRSNSSQMLTFNL